LSIASNRKSLIYGLSFFTIAEVIVSIKISKFFQS